MTSILSEINAIAEMIDKSEIDPNEQDRTDYTLIMDTLSDMSVISTQVLRDVIEDIHRELEDRTEPEETESLADIERAENNDIDRQEHSHNARGRL